MFFKNYIFHYEDRFCFYVSGKNSKFHFRFNSLKDLNISVRSQYSIMKIVRLEVFQDNLHWTPWLFTNINTTVYLCQHDRLPHWIWLFVMVKQSFVMVNTIIYHGKHDCLMYIISLHDRLPWSTQSFKYPYIVFMIIIFYFLFFYSVIDVYLCLSISFYHYRILNLLSYTILFSFYII